MVKTFEEFAAWVLYWEKKEITQRDYREYVKKETEHEEHLDNADAYYSARLGF